MESFSMRSILHAALFAVLLLSACGGGGGGSDSGGITPPPEPPPGGNPPPTTAVTKAEAARVLTQASFGPTQTEIDALAGQTLASWVDAQLAAPPSLHLPLYRTYNTSGDDGNGPARTARQEAWFEHALAAPDQLRQRVAFALSEIMVVSEQGAGLNNVQHGLAWYYDILVANAFGDFRTLLEQVTLAPAMGRYLSMLGNQKPNPATGLRADENFAREIMQLMTLGLVQLNTDGTPRVQGGQALSSYTQIDIENLARVFTGWWFAGANRFGANPQNWTAPMVPYEDFHDRDAKILVGNVAVPAGLGAAQDLDLALDTLFQHPNVGPFIGRQLIQKLVTSNPSPAYVGRVASAFNDNGAGVRGDMKALVRAILLDEEARRGTALSPNFGKPREPLLVQTHLWRALSAARGNNGRYTYATASADFGQAALAAPSVFNFFSPSYMASGAIANAGLFSPEFQLANESSIAIAFNRLYTSIFRDYAGNGGASPANAIRVDLANLVAQSADPAALVESLNLLLSSGQMSAAEKSALAAYLTGVSATAAGGRQRAQEALYLILTSPMYLVQK